MTAEYRILLVDDQPLLLQALERLLGDHGFTVVGAAASPAEALRFLERETAGVVIVDLTIPDLDQLAFIRELRRSHPETGLVIVAGSDDEAAIRATLQEGVVAYVRREADPRDLVTAVRQAFKQSVFFQLGPAPATREKVTASAARLTARELEILRLVAEGRSNAEIARGLWVTEQTVKFHLSNIYRKLGVSNRTEASHYAHVHGLFSEADAAGA